VGRCLRPDVRDKPDFKTASCAPLGKGNVRGKHGANDHADPNITKVLAGRPGEMCPRKSSGKESNTILGSKRIKGTEIPAGTPAS